MNRRINIIVLLTLAYGVGAAEPRDRFGGWAEVRSQAAGFFRAEQTNGVWWLMTPEGQAFFSKGVNHVSFSADRAPALGYAPYERATAAKYGAAQKWAETTATRLRGWGFNTIGAWSGREMFEQRMPYTVILNLAANPGANWQRGEVAHVYSPRFAQAVQEQARRLCPPRAKDPYLLGYFSDN